jgi:hypothetical protein
VKREACVKFENLAKDGRHDVVLTDEGRTNKYNVTRRGIPTDWSRVKRRNG